MSENDERESLVGDGGDDGGGQTGARGGKLREKEGERDRREQQTRPPRTMHRSVTVTRRTVTMEAVAGGTAAGADAVVAGVRPPPLPLVTPVAAGSPLLADVREDRCVPIAPGCVITTPAPRRRTAHPSRCCYRCFVSSSLHKPELC